MLTMYGRTHSWGLVFVSVEFLALETGEKKTAANFFNDNDNKINNRKKLVFKICILIK